MYAATMASYYKKVVQEILNQVEQWTQAAKFYRDKMETKNEDGFAIGKDDKVEEGENI